MTNYLGNNFAVVMEQNVYALLCIYVNWYKKKFCLGGKNKIKCTNAFMKVN